MPPLGDFNEMVLAYITSNLEIEVLESDFLINPLKPEQASTNFKIFSYIRLHKLVTLPQNHVPRKLGKLNKALQLEIDQKISDLFELKR